MKTSYILLGFCLSFLLPDTASAQQMARTKATSPAASSSPPVSTSQKASKQGPVIENIIKFDPLQLAHGEFGLHYERRLSDQLGLEVGGGITFRDYVWHLGRSFSSNDFMQNERIVDYKNGLALRTALRLYPVGNWDEPSRFFMGIGVQFRTYSWETEITDYVPSAGANRVSSRIFDESRVHTDIKVIFGQQHFLNTNMMVEYYVAAALRVQQLSGVNFDSWADPYTGVDPVYERNTTSPNFVFGLRLAYGF